MQLDLFQLLCLPTLLLAYAFSVATAADRGRRVVEIVALAASAWIGEHTVIEAYTFYFYEDDWWAFVGHVPLLVPLIWPMVVLSARDVAAAIAPEATPLQRALAVGAIVAFDASVMEVIAVAGGYWTWFEGGYLSVPLMGIIGWGCFGFVATLWLDWHERQGRIGILGWTPMITVVATHLLLVGIWWGGLRWVLRGPLPVAVALAGFAVVAMVFAAAVWRAQQRGAGVLPLTVVAPRLLATSVFVALLISLPDAGPQWGHLLIAGVPYALASRRLFKPSSSAEATRAVSSSAEQVDVRG